MLRNQADAVIQLKFQERFLICCIYSLVCNGINSFPNQTKVQLHFYNTSINQKVYFFEIINLLRGARSQSAVAYKIHYKVLLPMQIQMKIRLPATNLNHLKKGRKKGKNRRESEIVSKRDNTY